MITKNYIKMCEKAEEIQKAWKPVDWDRFIYKDDLTLGIACIDKKEVLAGSGKIQSYMMEHYIWLPTLEQLFETAWKIVEKYRVQMYFGINECEGGFQLQVNPVSPNFNYEKEYSADSIKGCLLQYIYEEKYHKTWTGEKWDVIDEF